MIIDLKRSIDLRWLFDPVLSFILRWSCFGCWQSFKINITRVAKAALHQVKLKSQSCFPYLACLSRLFRLSHHLCLSCLSFLSWLTPLLYFSPDVLTTDILYQILLLKWFGKHSISFQKIKQLLKIFFILAKPLLSLEIGSYDDIPFDRLSGLKSQ